jgi:hypothetical protein
MYTLLEKSDQHDMYASHVNPRMQHIHFLWAVPVHGNLSRSHQYRLTVTAPEKKGSRSDPQHAN